MTSLRDLDLPTRGYRLPKDPLVDEVLNPCFASAHRVRGLFGYFTSSVLAQLAPGLAQFLQQPRAQPIDFIVSPSLSEADAAAIEAVLDNPQPALEDLLAEQLLRGELAENRDEVEKHTLRCFAWLLAKGMLRLQVAYIRGGLFHEKSWEFADDAYADRTSNGHAVYVTGSANATRSALRVNHERMSVFPTYADGIDQHLAPLQDSFDDAFAGRGFDAIWPVSDALANEWIERWKGESEPTEGELRSAARRVGDSWLVNDKLRTVDVPDVPTSDGRPHIPRFFDWHQPPYEHQKEAVAAWEADHAGILEMATGAGKTYVSLIAATRAAHEQSTPFLLVIAVPFSLLVRQWLGDCRLFGMKPLAPTIDADGRMGKISDIADVIDRLSLGLQPFACLVITHHLAADTEFGALIEDAKDLGVRTMLIGDEVHRLGAPRFIAHPPRSFSLRLGLSATPARQYDQEGTKAITDYFGGIAYRFGLGRAIGNCLVRYDYHVVSVHLTDGELREFLRLSDQIARLYKPKVTFQENPAYAAAVNRRRRFLDTVSGKLPALEQALARYSPPPIRHTLIYSTSRDSSQIDDVQGMLDRGGVSNARITYEETPDGDLVSSIIEDFREGRTGVLNAMKVLDEGFNIPEITCAYLLSSTGTEREWTQRRGRVLRRAEGKDKATIIDFAVMPPPGTASTPALRRYLETEIGRIEAFAAHSDNTQDPSGGYRMINQLLLDFLSDGRTTR